jgi:hypothetical protein
MMCVCVALLLLDSQVQLLFSYFFFGFISGKCSDLDYVNITILYKYIINTYLAFSCASFYIVIYKAKVTTFDGQL